MSLFLPGPLGPLEAELWLPEAAGAASPAVAAVMCHPNPAAGGTMRTTALFRASRGLQQAGAAVLRFNFRGVGASAGTIEAGDGEIGDARAALEWLAGRFPSSALWCGGFSFGARTAAKHALDDPRVERLVLIGVPVLAFDCEFLERLRVPGLILQAGRDRFGNLADLRRRHERLDPRLELDQVDDCDHFFEGRTRELQERVAAYAAQHIGGHSG